MNWYKKYIVSQQATMLPELQPAWNKTYLDVGHGELEGVSLWTYSDSAGFNYTTYHPDLHGDDEFTHNDDIVPFPSGPRIQGRFDARTNQCSIATYRMDIPIELIWKLQETFGDNIKIINFSPGAKIVQSARKF